MALIGLGVALTLFIYLQLNAVAIRSTVPLKLSLFGLGPYCLIAVTLSIWSLCEYRDGRSLGAVIAAIPGLLLAAIDTFMILVLTGLGNDPT